MHEDQVTIIEKIIQDRRRCETPRCLNYSFINIVYYKQVSQSYSDLRLDNTGAWVIEVNP